MHIIHVTTNGMADHAYEIKWDEDLEKNTTFAANDENGFYGGWFECAIPSISLERLGTDEQYALSHHAAGLGAHIEMTKAEGAEREAMIARASAERRAVLAKYLFARDAGLVDQERYELHDLGLERDFKRQWRWGRGQLFHPTFEQDFTKTVMRFVLEKFDYTLLSCEEARSQYLEPAEIPEGIYLPHPTKPNALLPLDGFPERQMTERLLELFDVLAEMGATKIFIKEVENSSREGESSLQAGQVLDASMGGSLQRSSRTEAEVHLTGDAVRTPAEHLLKNSTWFQEDQPLHFLLRRQRSQNRVTYFRYELETDLKVELKASVAVALASFRSGAAVSYEELKQRSLALEASF